MQELWKFIIILITTLLVLTGYSFVDFDIEIANKRLKKTEIKNFILGQEDEMFALEIRGRDTVKQVMLQQPMDTSSQRILLIGDSMLEGIMLRFKDYTAQNNHYLKTVIWYSSSTLWYGRSDTLRYFIDKYKPTYVVLVLGANELFVRNIKRRRTRYVKHILEQIDTLNFVWIGPPNWKDDTGINDMILDNVGELHYYPSKKLNFRRARDGAHPTHSSAAEWTDSIAVWIENGSYRPIKMERPTKKNRKSANVTILQPLK